MAPDLQILIVSAITIALLHTVTGPDHYLPFIALAKARRWTFVKTICWTMLCGCAHVWSSVFIGLGAAALGWSVSKIEWLQQVRGGLAGWAMLLFGILYIAWAMWRSKRQLKHKHFDVAIDGSLVVYEHSGNEAVAPKDRHAVTPWVMFIIFLLGPCEPMVALLYYPAATSSLYGILLLIAIYTVFTLIAMLAMVSLGFYGLPNLYTTKLEKYMQPLSGLTILVCGVGMLFLNW